MEKEEQIKKIEELASLSDNTLGLGTDELDSALIKIGKLEKELGITFHSAPGKTLFEYFDYYAISDTGSNNSQEFHEYDSKTMFVNPNRKLINANQCLYLDVKGVPVFATYQGGYMRRFVENFIGAKKEATYNSWHIPCIIPYKDELVLYGKIIGDGDETPLRFIAYEIVNLQDGAIRLAKTYEDEIELIRLWGFETVPVAFLDYEQQQEVSVKALEKSAEMLKIPADGCVLIG